MSRIIIYPLRTNKIKAAAIGVVMLLGILTGAYLFSTNSISLLSYAVVSLCPILAIILLRQSFQSEINVLNDASIEHYFLLGFFRLNSVRYERKVDNEIVVEQDNKKYFNLYIVLKNGERILVDRYPTQNNIENRRIEISRVLQKRD